MRFSSQTIAARTRFLLRPLPRWCVIHCLSFSLVICAGPLEGQQPGQATPASPAPASSASSAAATPTTAAKPPSNRDRRRAAKLYLASSKLFEQEKYAEAMKGYEEAARLDPTNPDYALAAGVARSHRVTVLIQAAAKDRTHDDPAAARATLAEALALDHANPQIAQHLNELADDALAGQTKPLYAQGSDLAGPPEELAPTPGRQNFHIHVPQHQMIEQVFKAYGIQATVDDSIHFTLARLDVDDVSFAEAARVLALLTHSFYVPLDAHRVVVALDTPENRQKFVPQDEETLYLSGLTAAEMTDVGNLAKNVFNIRQAVVSPSSKTLTVRAPEPTLKAINATLSGLMEGHNQVLLDVRMIQLAHNNDRNTGVEPPTTMTAFNLYAEEQQILSQNQSLVQEIISQGLASADDPLAIILILIASGQVSSSIFSNGGALFGGGKTLSAVSPSPASVNLSLNSSDSRELDQVQIRLGDGEDATLRLGERYPIETSSFSSTLAGSSIPGLNSAGASGALSSLLSSLQGAAAQTIPQIQYEDLGLTLKATPKVMRSGMVALTLDMKITALAGSAVNGLPVLDNQSFAGVVTLDANQSVVIVSEMDKQESSAISGTPGVSEIPGMNDLTDKDVSLNTSSLLIVITPHVVRGTQAAGHSPMMRVDKDTTTR
jgi:general secretion pathway protein D